MFTAPERRAEQSGAANDAWVFWGRGSTEDG